MSDERICHACKHWRGSYSDEYAECIALSTLRMNEGHKSDVAIVRNGSLPHGLYIDFLCASTIGTFGCVHWEAKWIPAPSVDSAAIAR